MCDLGAMFQGLFGVKPAAPAAPATTVIRESRKAGAVKNTPVEKPSAVAAPDAAAAIGISIGNTDTPRKRTTELGL